MTGIEAGGGGGSDRGVAVHPGQFRRGAAVPGGSHMFDLALMFCGDEVAQGCRWLSNPGDFDPGGIGIFETKKGVRIVIDGAVGMSHKFQVDLVGAEGGVGGGVDHGAGGSGAVRPFKQVRR